MSAARLVPHHPETLQARCFNALRSLVYRIGLTEAGDLLGVDRNTIARRLETGNIDAFGWADVIALKKRERDEFGTSALHDEETRAFYRRDCTLNINLDLSATLMRETGEDAGIIGEASAILQDGKVDVADLPKLKELKSKLQERAEHTRELESRVIAKIEDLQREVRS